jgi:NAD(P)H-flavin reductase
MIQKFKVTWKKNLTHDVYEMVFSGEKELEMKPWQFITFLIDKIWGRAYSILKIKWNKITLIIKKRELENWGRWWSKLICELNIWDILKWVWPAGHFILQENNKNRLFIGTWTWFVPLYNQIIWIIDKNIKIKLLFWVKQLKDLFYIKELEEIKNQNPNFDFQIYLSREESEKYNKWYVTDFLTKNNISNFEEFYICWAPMMIESVIEKLTNLWFREKEDIFYEKY